MIKLFGATDTEFTSNGDIVLKPLLAVVHKQDNGDYYLELETGLDYVDDLVEGRIIVANTPTGDQPFRVNNIHKTTSKIKTTCRHVFYDSKNYLTQGASIMAKDCNDALGIINDNAEPLSPFNVRSDVRTINSMDIETESLYDAFMDVLETYGGHLMRDGFDVSIQDEIGHDNGVLVQYKKNLQDITCEENWDNVVTTLLPVGSGGIMLNAVNPSASVYVESDTQYSIPYCKTVTFSQDIDAGDYPNDAAYKAALVEDLKNQAQAYVVKNCLPQVSYTLSANVDRITDIGDVIAVRDKRLGVDLITRVIGFDYDCIFKKYKRLEFGNFTRTIKGLANVINSKSTVDFVQYVDKGTLLAVIKINGKKHYIYAP